MPTQLEWSEDYFRVPYFDWKSKKFEDATVPSNGFARIDGNRLFSDGARNSLMYEMLSTIQALQLGAWDEIVNVDTAEVAGTYRSANLIISVQVECHSVSPAADWIFGEPDIATIGKLAFGDPDDYFEPWQPVSFKKSLLKNLLGPARQFSWWFRPPVSATFHVRTVSEKALGMRTQHAYNTEEDAAPFALYPDGSPVDFPLIWDTFDVFPPRIE